MDRNQKSSADHIIEHLLAIDVDGETMEYIIKSVGMDMQMLKQLGMNASDLDINNLLEERTEFHDKGSNEHLCEDMDEPERYPRFCDETKEGIFVGYVFDDGDYICSTDEEVEKMCKEHGYDSREEAYEDGLYYYTEWEECDEDWWYEKDGDDWFEVSNGERIKLTN